MEVSINAETAAKIKALERIGPLFRDATPERKGNWRIWTLRAS